MGAALPGLRARRLSRCRRPRAKPLAPTSIYAIGKRDHEEMFLACGRAYGIPVTALRFFNVYGPRQALSNPYTGVGGDLRLASAQRAVAADFEDGGQSRDFVHVSDIVAGVASRSSRARAISALNLGGGETTSVLQVAEMLAGGARGRHRAGNSQRLSEPAIFATASAI